MSVETLVVEGRIEAEALMLDTIEFRCNAGGSTLNETTGRTIVTSTLIYSGPCKVQAQKSLPQPGEVAGRESVVQRYEIHLPVSVLGVLVGDVGTILTSDLDSELVGRKFRVSGLHHKSQATARRLAVEETTS